MIRISDILKKAKEAKQKEGEAPLSKAECAQGFSVGQSPPDSQSPHNAPEPEVVSHRQAPQGPLSQAKKEAKEKGQYQPSDISIASILNKPASAEESEKVYQDMFSLAQMIGEGTPDYTAAESNRIVTQIEKMADQLILGNEKLLMLAFLKDSAETNYLFSHWVNVCIYSVEIGLAQGYPRLNFIELGVLALLHDTAMVKYLFSACQRPELSNDERDDLKTFSAALAQVFSCINGFCNLPNESLRQDDNLPGNVERFINLKAESFSRYAKLINVVDFYEAMTHKGIYGDKHSSLEAVQEILNNKEKFDQSIIKVLIDRIGIFPVGSFIRLSTREIAQVIRLNKGKPLRPIIKILYDTEGKKLQAEKILDLSMHPTIYIKEEEKAVNPVRKDAAF